MNRWIISIVSHKINLASPINILHHNCLNYLLILTMIQPVIVTFYRLKSAIIWVIRFPHIIFIKRRVGKLTINSLVVTLPIWYQQKTDAACMNLEEMFGLLHFTIQTKLLVTTKTNSKTVRWVRTRRTLLCKSFQVD